MKRPKASSRKGVESPEDVPIEPGADKRLANILKKALNTPPLRTAGGQRKQKKK